MSADISQTLQESPTTDECESFTFENVSKAILDTKDSIEIVLPHEKFNKQLQFLQLFFKKLLSGQGYSQSEIHANDPVTQDFLELESSML